MSLVKHIVLMPVFIGWACGKCYGKGPVDTCRIAIESTYPGGYELCKKILQYHGGFAEDRKNCQVMLLLNRKKGRIQGYLRNQNASILLFEGVDALKTYLKICDCLVENIFGTPGYFCSTLLFISDVSGNPEIYVADFLFNEVRQLTFDRATVLHPKWHPQGKSIAYTTYGKSGFPDIYCLESKRKQPRCIANYKGINSMARFNPSGTLLAMVLTVNKVPQVCTCDLYGRGVRLLTNSPGIKSSIAWLDDQNIIFSWENNAPLPQLFQIRLARGPEVREPIIKLPIGISRFLDEACVSLDKRQLLFTGAEFKKLQLGCMELRDNRVQFVTRGPLEHMEGCWLADGRHVICTEKSSSTKRLVLCDTWTRQIVPLPCERFNNTYQVDVLPYDAIN